MKIWFSTNSEHIHRDLKGAAEWAAKRLLPPEISEILDIEISLSKNLDVAGVCLVEDFENRRNPRFFSITINPDLCEYHPVRTLMHEMVHVKQFALGELYDKVKKHGHVLWKYRQHAFSENMPKSEYLKLPWEQEAYGMEEALFDEWLEHE